MTKRKAGKHEGSMTRRPNGTYQYRVMIDGRRIATYGKTKDEARAKMSARIALIGDQSHGVEFEALLDAWIALGYEGHGMAPTTFDQYRYLLSKHIRPKLGARRVESITAKDVTKVLRGIERSASTRRSIYQAMKHIMELAVDRELVGTNVMGYVKRPRLTDKVKRSLSQAEAMAILMAAKDHRWEIAVWLGLGEGLRRGEMLGLRWADIDLAARQVHITGNVTRSSAGLVRGKPKTRRGTRLVPLSAEVVDALRQHRKRQTEERLRAGSAWDDSGHVLTNEVGGMAEPRKLSRVWASWARQAGVTDRGTHVGRYFAATTMLASGQASVTDIAEMLGHDPAVLLSTYASSVAKGQRAASDVLGAALSVVK
jgi:integrase